jgi:N-acetylmuramoyl-L-alanine amidase
MREELAKTPKPLRQSYLACIRTYQLVYKKDPHYGGSDDAIYEAGLLFEEMAQRFGESRYAKEALRFFEFLVSDYGFSPHKQDALKRVAASSAAPVSTFEVVAVTEAPPAASADASPRLVHNIRHWSSSDHTRVMIDMDRETRFIKTRLSDPDRIFFDISNSKLSRDLADRTFRVGDKFLRQIRAGQNRSGVVRVVLDLERGSQVSVSELREPFRIVIDLRAAGASPSAPATAVLKADAPAPPVRPPQPEFTPKPAPPTSRGDRTLTRMLGLKISRIVLDPGHGGHDTGAVGPNGLKEKDLVLEISLSLKKMLEEELGAEVVLTRSDDSFIPLEERTAIANQQAADLFVSIHANSSRLRTTSGVETYFLDFAHTDAEREVAARENATTLRSVHDLQDLVKKIAQADKSAESRELARVIQKNLYSGTRRLFAASKDRGVRRAPFVVLIGANMPSILAEVAFLSNPRDEKILKKEGNRQRLAKALFNGIEGYMKVLGSDTVQLQKD